MSQFSLRRHFPSKIDYWVSEEAPDGPLNLQSVVTTSGGPNTANPLDWRISIEVVFHAKVGTKEMLKGTIVYVGYFDAPQGQGAEGEALDRFMIANATSMLYAATRELLVNLSARTLTSMVILPPAFFGKKEFLVKKEEQPRQVRASVV